MPRLSIISSVLIAVCVPGGNAAADGLAVQRAHFPSSEGPTTLQLGLPPGFRLLIEDRATIDLYQLGHFEVETGTKPTPVAIRKRRGRPGAPVRVVRPVQTPAMQQVRAALDGEFFPLRSFSAPMLEDSALRVMPEAVALDGSRNQADAMSLVNDRLAIDGLLKTLAETIELLGPPRFVTTGREGLQELSAIGFPVDLLACFASRSDSTTGEASLEVVRWVARLLVTGEDAYAVENALGNLEFRWPRAWSTFEAASETGTEELAMLRMQVGSGYDGGIIRGDCVDLLGQLVRGLPHIDFLVTTPSVMAPTIAQWAQLTLPVFREDQLTLVAQPSRIEAWAQDNGKAGTVRDPLTGTKVMTTLAPRYASRGEGRSLFLPNESLLMDGLQAAGLRVQHFPLLFQGGNLLPVHDPKTGKRLLLIGEGVIHRNVPLGLSHNQVLEAFRRGLGVEECVVFPGLSYHLDFDVNIREIDGELVAFVNDPQAAVHPILKLGIRAFQKHGVIDQTAAIALERNLDEGDGSLAYEQLSALVRRDPGPVGMFGATTASMFKTAGVDLAAGNLQVFLQALDLLESGLDPSDHRELGPDRKNYLQALRRMESARLAQNSVLKSRGWRIVAVPGLPDLGHSINYLNGIHHRDGYVLPVYGGFYQPLDDLAAKVFRDAIGENQRILRIQCAALQRRHGAVHCAASAHPRIENAEPSS